MSLQRDIQCFCWQGTAVIWSSAMAAAVLISSSTLADISQPKLAEFVRDGIKTDAIMVEPPRVSIDGQELTYNVGKILYPNYGTKPEKPIDYPIQIQATVELIRKYRAKEKEELTFLKPYLGQMEKIVADQLVFIAKHRGNANELTKTLADQNKRAQQILADGIEKWAAKRGLRVSKNAYHAAAVMPTVTFTSSPAGATVYYLNAVDYNISRAENALDHMDRWNQVPGKQMDMGGAYYFRAAWPGGKMKQTAKILIDKEQTISLQAN